MWPHNECTQLQANINTKHSCDLKSYIGNLLRSACTSHYNPLDGSRPHQWIDGGQAALVLDRRRAAHNDAGWLALDRWSRRSSSAE